jgi:hypothetical protein
VRRHKSVHHRSRVTWPHHRSKSSRHSCLALTKPSLVAGPSLKPPSTEAFGPNPCAAADMPILSDCWTITHVCSTGLATRQFRLAKPKPLYVAPPPPTRVDASWATMDGSSSAVPHPSAQPIDPFMRSASHRCSEVRFGGFGF